MAAVGPYGIEQFDAPGVIGNMQNMQFNRVRMMMMQKQVEMEDLMMNRQMNAMKAVQAYYGNGSQASPNASGSDSSASGASSTGTPQPSAAAAPDAPVMPHADDVVAPPAQPSGPYSNGAPTATELANRQRVLAALNSTGNSELADQFMKGFASMDTMQQQAYQAKNAQGVRLMAGILQLPYNQRKAAIMANSSAFQAMGYPPDQIANFDPTDYNVRQKIAEHSDMDHIMQMVMPHFESERPGGAITETQPYDYTKTVAESPIVESGGAAYARPPSLSQMPQPMTATNPKTGERVQSLDGGKTWQPLGGQTPPASGGFQ